MPMTTLKKIIRETPFVQPVDAVKLAYQSAFGCGHLLAEEEAVARRVEEEMAAVAQSAEAAPFLEIGGGLCRLNLRAVSVRRLSPTLLAQMMSETARQKPGTAQGFQARLHALGQACGEGLFSFDVAALDRYLAEYARMGYPPVSHSNAYRSAYAPAYRVVLREYGDALLLLGEVEERLKKDGKCLLVLDGDCGGGKTTLANTIAPLFGAQTIGMDEFFLPTELRTPERLQEAGGNIHYERFRREVTAGLLRGEPFVYGSYRCHEGRMMPCRFEPAAVTLIEGSYSHHPAFAADYERLNALRVWVSVEEGEQLRRLEKRNPALTDRFKKEWIPMEKAFLHAFDGRGNAHLALESRPWAEDWV